MNTNKALEKLANALSDYIEAKEQKPPVPMTDIGLEVEFQEKQEAKIRAIQSDLRAIIDSVNKQ